MSFPPTLSHLMCTVTICHTDYIQVTIRNISSGAPPIRRTIRRTNYMLETKLHTYTKVVEDEEYSIIRKNIQDKICNDDVAILANTHKPSFLPLMEDREMALKMWHPGSRNTCVISKDSLILALAARSPSPCSADCITVVYIFVDGR